VIGFGFGSAIDARMLEQCIERGHDAQEKEEDAKEEARCSSVCSKDF